MKYSIIAFMLLFGIISCSDTDEIVEKPCSNEVLEVEDVLEWRTNQDFPMPISKAKAFVIDNVGYFTFDTDPTDFKITYNFWKYELDADVWGPLDSIPIAHPNWIISSFSIGSKGYIITQLSIHEGDDVATVYEYDPVFDEWKVVSEVPGSSMSISNNTIVFEDEMYLIKPRKRNPNGNAEFDFELWKWEPNSNLWSELTDFPGRGRIYPFFFEQNGCLYYGMGGGTVGERDPLYDVWKYRPMKNEWSQISDFPVCSIRLSGPFKVEEQIFIAHSDDSNNAGNKMYGFVSESENWQRFNVDFNDMTDGGVVRLFEFDNSTHILQRNSGEDFLNVHKTVKFK